jgi:DNA-binding NtrC family response regulator
MLRAVKEKLRILIVDDQLPILLTYKLILQQQGHEVTAASSWEGAVSHLGRGKFDILLCDLGLNNGRNGFELIDLAQVRNPDMSAVLLTGYGAPEVDREAEMRGVPVLYKPVAIEHLLETLHSLTQASGAA